jgi:oxygen-independent coproporphyrinogen III oxidase
MVGSPLAAAAVREPRPPAAGPRAAGARSPAGREAPAVAPLPAIRFDRRLLRRYDRPGPRYTSYPTAPWFGAGFGPEEHAALLAASRGAPLPLSLYVHVPFCETRCFFCGCNVTVSRNRERARDYLELLAAEMALAAPLLGAGERRTIQVHWGGGTPNFLPAADLARLAAAIRRHFRLAPECEFSVEIDPRTCGPEQLDALAAAGVNRLSLGIQDFDPRVQEAVNRVQPAEVTWEVLAGARRRGIASVNVDLIYGLPYQTPESFRRTVGEVVEMAPDRVAVFNFAYLPAMFRHQRVIPAAALPDPEAKLTLLEETVARLVGEGYVFIGMDHFARPEDPLAAALADGTLSRNFQGYATGGETDLVAFGVSSISKVAGGYAQNAKEIPAYREALAAGRLATSRGILLSAEDRLRRDVIMGLMCHFRLEKAAVEAAHGIAFDRHFARELEALRPLADDGLVTLAADRIEVTPPGRLLVRNVAMAFDAYLRPAAGEGTPEAPQPAYSRTV